MAQRLHASRMQLANCLTSRYPINAGSTLAISVKKLSKGNYPGRESNLASLVCEASALTTTLRVCLIPLFFYRYRYLICDLYSGDQFVAAMKEKKTQYAFICYIDKITFSHSFNHVVCISFCFFFCLFICDLLK